MSLGQKDISYPDERRLLQKTSVFIKRLCGDDLFLQRFSNRTRNAVLKRLCGDAFFLQLISNRARNAAHVTRSSQAVSGSMEQGGMSRSDFSPRPPGKTGKTRSVSGGFVIIFSDSCIILSNFPELIAFFFMFAMLFLSTTCI